jgi:hypothetical protein
MNNFTELCNLHKTDKGTMTGEQHSYSLVYDEQFGPIKDSALKVLEIGIADPRFPGASLRVLSEYFTKAEIHGFDIVDCSHFQIPRVLTHVGDTSRAETLDILVNNKPYDIIIDDGIHIHEHHMICFNKLYKCLAPNGMYIIEDLHPACSWPTKEYFLNLDESGKSSLGIKDVKIFCHEKLLIIYN